MSVVTFIQDFLTGAVASWVAKTGIAPIERVKLLLQLQAANPQIEKDQQYKGIIDCMKRIYTEQGFLAFWRGNMANVVRYFPTASFSLALKDLVRQFNTYDPKTQPKKYLLGNMASGGLASSIVTVVAFPMDFARTRVASDVAAKGQKRLFNGMLDWMQKIYAKDGLGGLYRGLAMTIPQVVIYRSIYFGFYDTGKILILSDQSAWYTKWMMAQTITSFGSLLVYPLDTIRRRIMMTSGEGKQVQSSARDVAKKIYANEGGISGFFKGGFTNMIRTAGGAMLIVVYDILRDYLKDRK